MLNVKKTMTKILDFVEDILGFVENKESNSIGDYVDISGYNSVNKMYTFPSDGYVFTYNAANTSSVLTVVGGTDSGSTIAIGSINSGRDSLYVRKGMKCYATGTFGAVRFNPINGGGYFLKVLFHRLAERWWEYAEHKETSHQNTESSTSYIDGSEYSGNHSGRVISMGKCAGSKRIHSDRGILYRFNFLLNEEYNDQHKRFNHQPLREKLDKCFRIDLRQCASKHRIVAISERGWSCA